MSIIEQAREIYKPGVKYRTACCPGDIIYEMDKSQVNQIRMNGEDVWASDGKGILYFDGKWAEIITNHYEIY